MRAECLRERGRQASGVFQSFLCGCHGEGFVIDFAIPLNLNALKAD